MGISMKASTEEQHFPSQINHRRDFSAGEIDDGLHTCFNSWKNASSKPFGCVMNHFIRQSGSIDHVTFNNNKNVAGASECGAPDPPTRFSGRIWKGVHAVRIG